MIESRAIRNPILRRPATMLIAVFLLLAGVFYLLDLQSRMVRGTAPEIVTGTIVMFGSMRSKNRVSSNRSIVVELEDGSRKEFDPALRDIRGCEIGGKIWLHKRGGRLEIAPKACGATN